jgi:hypothetical protein
MLNLDVDLAFGRFTGVILLMGLLDPGMLEPDSELIFCTLWSFSDPGVLLCGLWEFGVDTGDPSQLLLGVANSGVDATDLRPAPWFLEADVRD